MANTCINCGIVAGLRDNLCCECYDNRQAVLADPVNHPTHYTSHPSGIEVICITRHMGFNLGNVIKYVLRADHKGNKIEDLKKAQWYLSDEIKKLENNQ